MINNKRGLSTIIVTVLLIGLTIAAVGIVAVVVNNVLNKQGQTTDFATRCLAIDVSATSATCSTAPASTCIVRLERAGSGTDTIAAVKLLFENATGSRTSTPIDSASGNIAQLGTFTTVALTSGVVNASKVNAIVYLKDATGTIQNCPNPSTFTF